MASALLKELANGCDEGCTWMTQLRRSACSPYRRLQNSRVSIRTLDRMIHKQELPAFKVGGQWRLAESQLTEWIERHEQLARVALGPAGGSLCWRNDADNVARC
ncbi:MAG: helix-turn-helix domain-containing protein [Candidatus Binatia bacterium]